jgi:hypothetical protein
MGAWFIYLVPIALFVASLRKLSNLVMELTALPTLSAKEFIPQRRATA